MKIQKIPVDSKDAVVFSVNETKCSAKEGWASISIPSETFKGKGKSAPAVSNCFIHSTTVLRSAYLIELILQNSVHRSSSEYA